MFQYYDIHTHKSPDGEYPADRFMIFNLYKDFARSQQIKFCSIGMHPRFLYNYMQDFSTLELNALNPNVLAIGECGFDKMSKLDMELQQLIFHHHLELANTIQKPLIVHCVKAYDELLKYMDEHPPTVPVIFHGFNRTEKIAEKILKKGYYLSFGKPLLYATDITNTYFHKLDPAKVFLETDDDGCGITDLYAAAAKLRNVPESEIITQIRSNFKKVFLLNV